MSSWGWKGSISQKTWMPNLIHLVNGHPFCSGTDQAVNGWGYALVGVYTVPIDGKGDPLYLKDFKC